MSLIGKKVHKHANRAKEMLLVNLGRTEQTKDDVFEDFVENFSKQQANFNKLSKAVKVYSESIAAMQASYISLVEVVSQSYEDDWFKCDSVRSNLTKTLSAWSEYKEQIENQVSVPLTAYMSQFPGMRDKIAKRGRKLVDYDSSRHMLDAMLANKKRDDAKVTKMQENCKQTKEVFEKINGDLHESLPALYDSRISFLISNFQSLFLSESNFHAELQRINAELNDLMDNLANEVAKGLYSTLKPQAPTNLSYTSTDEKFHSALDIASHGDEKLDRKKSVSLENVMSKSTNPFDDDLSDDLKDNACVNKTHSKSPSYEDENSNCHPVIKIKNCEDPPSDYLYKVRAVHNFTGKDFDELSFKKDDVIYVLNYNQEQEELDEGWLFGFKEGSGEKGLFPENFVTLIDS